MKILEASNHLLYPSKYLKSIHLFKISTVFDFFFSLFFLVSKTLMALN